MKKQLTAIQEKIKVFVFDSGDGKIYTKDIRPILDMIETDLIDLKKGTHDNLQYDIEIKLMTERQYRKLPEWT